MSDITRRNILQASTIVAGTAALNQLPSVATASERPGTPIQPQKVVVAGGHPDDPESGCGGTIARYADAGHEVVAIYLTRGEAGMPGTSYEEAARIRSAEAEKACKTMKARPLFAGQSMAAQRSPTSDIPNSSNCCMAKSRISSSSIGQLTPMVIIGQLPC